MGVASHQSLWLEIAAPYPLVPRESSKKQPSCWKVAEEKMQEQRIASAESDAQQQLQQPQGRTQLLRVRSPSAENSNSNDAANTLRRTPMSGKRDQQTPPAAPHAVTISADDRRRLFEEQKKSAEANKPHGASFNGE